MLRLLLATRNRKPIIKPDCPTRTRMGRRTQCLADRGGPPHVTRACHRRLPLLLPPLVSVAPASSPANAGSPRAHSTPGAIPGMRAGTTVSTHRNRGLLFRCLLCPSAGTLPEPPGRLPCRSHRSEPADALTPEPAPGGRVALALPAVPGWSWGSTPLPREPRNADEGKCLNKGGL